MWSSLLSGLISVMTLHYAANSGPSPWIDWLSWLESEPLEPILVLIKLSSQHQEPWNEMWPTDKEGCGGNSKLSMSYSSTQAHKEGVSMGGGVGGWQRLIISLYPGCWDYIFSLSFLWGYSSEEGASQLIFPAVIYLVKELCLLTVCSNSPPSPLLPLLSELSFVSTVGPCSDGKCVQAMDLFTQSNPFRREVIEIVLVPPYLT